MQGYEDEDHMSDVEHDVNEVSVNEFKLSPCSLDHVVYSAIGLVSYVTATDQDDRKQHWDDLLGKKANPRDGQEGPAGGAGRDSQAPRV